MGAFNAHLAQLVDRNINGAVRAIHGAGTAPFRDHDEAVYNVSVARYVLGFVFGTEWDETAVNMTNVAYAGMPSYVGTFVEALSMATPFENWLASMLDKVRRCAGTTNARS